MRHQDVTGIRRSPCASCPYRRDVPSGIWDAHEYGKLPRYDGSIAEQAMAGAFGVFFCHKGDGNLCAGWVGCHDMSANLAIRAYPGEITLLALLSYQSPVPLFDSGAEAAAHGKRDIAQPGPAAQRMMTRLLRQQR